MKQTTSVKLDVSVSLVPMNLAEALTNLHDIGVNVSRASLYRWNADLIAAGLPPLIHQPSGKWGRTFVVPAEVCEHIRSRCSANTPGNGVDAVAS